MGSPGSASPPAGPNAMTKVLFFPPVHDDFLAATVLHGLRALVEPAVVDHPRYDCMYRDYPPERLARQHGKGFTLFGRMPDPGYARSSKDKHPDPRNFDLTIIADIWNQTDVFLDLFPKLDPQKTAILDGSDDPALVPQAGRWFRRPREWSQLRSLRKFRTWKREWTPRSQPNAWHRLLPPPWLPLLPRPRRLHRISFGIPEEQIVGGPPSKKKDFPAHIVDEELREVLGAGSGGHVFASEEEYRRDLQSSRFGITMKRSGWDCLRHYEIAANGAVPCFRNLADKPDTCAPHGLTPDNSIAYRSASELMEITQRMAREEYRGLQAGALAWVRQHSTRAVASRFLREAMASP